MAASHHLDGYSMMTGDNAGGNGHQQVRGLS